MDDSALEFLDNKDVVSPAVEPEEQPEAQAPEETPQEPVAEPETQPEEPKPEQPMVPLAALQEVRDGNRELKRQLEELGKQVQPQQPKQEAETPDIFGATKDWERNLDQNIQLKLYSQTRAVSERFARKEHGDELVNQAKEWAAERCNADPYFNGKLFQSEDPIGMAVTEFQRDQLAQSFNPTDYQQFVAWKAAQAEAEPAPQQQQQKAPKSLAAVPSSGGAAHVPSGPGQAFEDVFKE